MAFQISRPPGRWAVYCPDDSFNFCTGISPNDFSVTWNVAAFGDTLTSVEVSPSVSGLIASIDTRPNGLVTNLTTAATVTMVYDAGDDIWEPNIEFGLTDQVFYRFSVSFNVTLTTGDSCSYTLFSDFQYIDLGSLPTSQPTVSGVQQVGETLTGADGYFDADGDPQDTSATVRRWYSYTDAAGTISETYLGAGSTYELTSAETNLYIRYKVIPYAVSGPSPGAENSSPVFGPIATDVVGYSLTNEMIGTFTFVQVLASTQAVGVDWGDGSALEVVAHTGSLAIPHVYPSDATKTVTVYVDPDEVTGFTASNEDILSFDASDLNSLSNLNLSSNSGLASLSVPTANTATWSSFQIAATALTGIINLSTLSDMPTTFAAQNSSGITGFVLPSSGTCTNFRADGCGLTGTIDFSNIDIYNQIRLSSNSGLTGITFSTSSGNTSLFQAFNCGLTGTLDISALTLTGNVTLSGNSLTGLTTSASTATTLLLNSNNFTTLDISDFTALTFIQLNNNSGLETLTLPASSGAFTFFRADVCALPYVDFTALTFATNVDLRLQNNAMTTAEVNCILVDLNATLPGSGTGKVNISGTNAAPDGSTGGCDGTTAAAGIAGKGYTVTAT